MTTTKQLVKAYNTLAMSMPDKVWTNRFAHPRMELVGTRVTLVYNHHVNNQFVPIKESIPIAEIPDEIDKLKRRAKERG